MVDTIDEDRRKFVKHHFGHDWPNRQLFHAMLNTGIGDDEHRRDHFEFAERRQSKRGGGQGMKPAIVIMAACLALLAGCAVGPDYRQPNVSTPSSWTSPLADGETNGPADLAAWWKNFGDTNLDSLMAVAVQSNLTLRVAEAHVREARAERDVASGSLWPSVGSSGSYSRNRYGANAFPPLAGFGVPLDYNLYSAGFDAAWELDIFGGTRRAVEAANAEMGAAEYSQRDVLVSLLAEVARNYIGARGYQQRLVITRKTSRSSRKFWT